jgi:flagellar protein FliS
MAVRLTQANAKNDPEIIDEVARLLITVKSGWDAIAPQ